VRVPKLFTVDMSADPQNPIVPHAESDEPARRGDAGDGGRPGVPAGENGVSWSVRAPRLTALAAFILLAVVHTWPLARDPAHLSRNDNGDTLLNTWAVAWVAHQLPRDPIHLFDANIFYPERRTLAYSEAMIVQGVMAMPIRAAGASPVLTYNLVLLAGFALTGWAFCLLVHRWTSSWSAGYMSGSLAAFNSQVLVRLGHLQTQHVEFIALMLFALDRLFVSRRVRDAVWLGCAFALQGLTSIYLLVFSTWMMIFAVIARLREWLHHDAAKIAGLLALAAGVAVLILAPYLLVYYELHRASAFERTVNDARLFAASWVNYLSTGSRLHYALWSQPYFMASMSPTFPGFVALALVGAALAWPEARRDPRVVMCGVTAAGCAGVSMLPNLPIYPALHRAIPLFRVVRVPAHLGQIVLLMVAVVAGYGLAGLQHRWPSVRTWPAVAMTLCALANIEALRAPLWYAPFSEIPPIYSLLAIQSGAVVVELPLYEPRYSFGNAPYMLNSTRHWRPLLNGFSGFGPASYFDTYRIVQSFPDTASLIALDARGVTHVVVHEEQFSGMFGRDRFNAIAGVASLQPVAQSGDIHLYRLR
jgi:hypothetical protein